MKKKIKETDLYDPIKDYFETKGYKVFAEVMDCDMTAEKDGMLMVIEIKVGFHTKLLFQAIDRQRFADGVYIAIPKPKIKSKDFSKINHIARELGLGLIIVSLSGPVKYLDILSEPKIKDKPRDNRRKRIAIKEAAGRSIDMNKGGMSKEKLATAYREKCIEIACILKKEKQIKPKTLRNNYGMGKEAGLILIDNHYGWFDRVSKGVYELSDIALLEMEQGKFKKIFDLYLEKYAPYE